MRLKLKCDSPGEAPINLGKLTVSVFPDRPEQGKITFDVEILRADNASVVVCYDRSASQEELSTLPYDETDDTLEDYLTEEDYEPVDDYKHIDSTGGKRHLVLNGDSEMSDIQPTEQGFRNQWRLNPDEEKDGAGEETTIDIRGEEVDCIKMLGDWFRLVGDWSGFRRDGLREEMKLSVETEEVTCDGLYIWYFAPDPYTIVRSESNMEVWDNGSLIDRFLRLSSESPSPDEYEEFTIWDGWIQNHNLVSNRDRIHWSSGNRRAELEVALTSPELRRRENERSFWLGALIAISATGALQMIVALIGQPGETVSKWWFVIFLLMFILTLAACFYYKSPWLVSSS